MKKIGMWIGGLGAIGTILFMLKNNFEDRKEIKRLDDESKSWKDAFKKSNKEVCALVVEKADVQYILRKMEEHDAIDMVKGKLTHTQAEMLDDYIWSD